MPAIDDKARFTFLGGPPSGPLGTSSFVAQSPASGTFFDRFKDGLGTKLIATLLGAMLIIFVILGYLTIRLHRQHLETSALQNAEGISDVIKHSTTFYMLRNDREAVYHEMASMAQQPGVERVRVFDREGKITYSTEPWENGRTVDEAGEECYGCHSQKEPLTKLNRPDRFRVYRNAQGQRVLAIITPIDNQRECSNAACHAHPESQKVLGVIDTHLSLARADAQLAQGTRQMLAYDFFAMIGVAFLAWLFVRRMVDRPLRQLHEGTERLTNGDLGFQIHLRSRDEIGDLATSFNLMSLQLRAANEEVVSWAQTLEARVEDKSRDLKRAHDELLHGETMASLGKMAAVVAHEINNPLSGILTYSKLIKKWIDRGHHEEKKIEIFECLDLIAAESRRCGDLVKNLLSFSHAAPMNVQPTDINHVLEQCVALVRHHVELAGITLRPSFANDLPVLPCDPSQIEQVLLALLMNAIDAMPRGGNLWLESEAALDKACIILRVRDDGAGIPADVLPKVFEPFVTTKESGRGTGLGLAVSRSIIQRHSGTIAIQSELGKGTTVTITLPVASRNGDMDVPVLAGTATETR